MTVISSSAPCAAIPLVRARPEYLNPDPWHRVLTLHTHRILSRLPLILQHRLTDSENLQPVVYSDCWFSVKLIFRFRIDSPFMLIRYVL
jgi:hypothetical protein